MKFIQIRDNFDISVIPQLSASFAEVENYVYMKVENFLEKAGSSLSGSYSVGTPDRNETLCFHKENEFWCIYYSERGLRTGPAFFISWMDAAKFFIWTVINDGTKSLPAIDWSDSP